MAHVLTEGAIKPHEFIPIALAATRATPRDERILVLPPECLLPSQAQDYVEEHLQAHDILGYELYAPDIPLFVRQHDISAFAMVLGRDAALRSLVETLLQHAHGEWDAIPRHGALAGPSIVLAHYAHPEQIRNFITVHTKVEHAEHTWSQLRGRERYQGARCDIISWPNAAPDGMLPEQARLASQLLCFLLAGNDAITMLLTDLLTRVHNRSEELWRDYAYAGIPLIRSCQTDIRPQDIDAAQLAGGFGKYESEAAARIIVSMCQERGGWYAFTRIMAQRHYERDGGRGPFDFGLLTADWGGDPPWIEQTHDNELYHVTDDFVRRCHETSSKKAT